MTRLDRVLALIDAANARDPNVAEGQPAELIYGQRMSAALASFRPEASETLQIAARGQHIERWTRPRSDYPMDRVGYLTWRRDAKIFHAERLAGLMAETGYSMEEAERVGALVRKDKLKQDAETQALEDVVCLVFLSHYALDFAGKHSEDKVIDILVKTWRKMSDEGHAAALSLDLPAPVKALVVKALGL